MVKYHKIQSIFKRDMDGPGKSKPMIYGAWTEPEFEFLANNLWQGTEKVDGTNVRIIYECKTTETGLSKTLMFRGKDDESDMPSFLNKRLAEIIRIEDMERIFGDTSVTLYGEGYGNKIQTGRRYSHDHEFILFDVKIGEFWLLREKVVEIGKQLGLMTVPIMFEGNLYEAIEYMRKEHTSLIADDKTLPIEGLVLVPKVSLFNRKGERIITKLKYKDFKNMIYA